MTRFAPTFACLILALALVGCSKESSDTPAAPSATPAASPTPAPAPAAAAAPASEKITDSPEPLEILLWHAYRGDERAALDQVIARFNESHENLSIRALPVPFDALVDKLQVTIPRGQGPDIFIFAHNMLGQWIESEAKPLVEPISSWAPPELLRSYQPEAIRPLVYAKSLYGLPLAYKALALFYNRKLVATAPKTTDELIAIAKQNTNPDEKRFGLAYEAGSLYFHAPWIHGFGGVVLDDAGEPQLDSEAGVQAAAFARALVQEHKVVPKGMTTFMVASLFNDGNAAMVLSGPWFRGDIKEGVDYGVAQLPVVSATGKRAAPFLGIEAVFMNAYSEKKQWAFEAMRYLTADASALVRCTVGKQPVPNIAVYDAPAVKADPHVSVFAAQAQHAVPMNASRRMQLVWSPTDNALAQAVFADDGDPKAALAEAQKKVRDDIARLKK